MQGQGFAANTKVSVERTKAEIDSLLGKHGAGQRALMHDEENNRACVVFTLNKLRYRINVPIPPVLECAPKKGAEPRMWWRWSADQRHQWVRAEHEQIVRTRWRGLLLLIKAKLEIVRMEVSTLEREFLADLVLPNGETAAELLGTYMKNLLADGYAGPPQLPEARP